MNLCRLLFVGTFLLVIGTVSSVNLANACGTAPPRNTPVAIADESAIIIWDEANKTQHFIRRASFTTEAPDFGFLVPTPSQPELGEASDEAFNSLAKITEPKVVKQPKPSGGGCGIGCSAGPRSGSFPSTVEVLDQKRIAGQDIVVLKATDAGDLTKWLADHGYEFSATLKEWVKPYIDQGWIITASKIAREPERAAPKVETTGKSDTPATSATPPKAETKKVGSAAVRMTFKTDKPFFPYSEPADQRASQGTPPRRLLRVYFLSTAKVQGALGDKGDAWKGNVVWANKIEATDREKLLDLCKLPKTTGPASWWLTEFEDWSSPRPGTADLFFSTAADQNAVERPPHIQYVSAGWSNGLMWYALACTMVVPCVVRRMRQKRPAE
jgi:hypothetical protein